MDFLVHLKEVDELKWRTIKLYVAGLRYYYQEIVGEIELAAQIPYPKEKPSLP
jgi:integrase/recombinase XerD